MSLRKPVECNFDLDQAHRIVLALKTQNQLAMGYAEKYAKQSDQKNAATWAAMVIMLSGDIATIQEAIKAQGDPTCQVPKARPEVARG